MVVDSSQPNIDTAKQLQERFFNPIFSNYYLPFIISTIDSIDIKEIHLTMH